jgi:hypothetical protein
LARFMQSHTERLVTGSIPVVGSAEMKIAHGKRALNEGTRENEDDAKQCWQLTAENRFIENIFAYRRER